MPLPEKQEMKELFYDVYSPEYIRHLDEKYSTSTFDIEGYLWTAFNHGYLAGQNHNKKYVGEDETS